MESVGVTNRVRKSQLESYVSQLESAPCKQSLLAEARVDSFAITFSNILAPNIIAWHEIFVVFDYLEYILSKSSNRPLSFLLFFLCAIGSHTI